MENNNFRYFKKFKHIFSSLILLFLISACTKKNQEVNPSPEISALTVSLGSVLPLGEIIKGKTKIFTVKIENPGETELTGPAAVSSNSPFSVLPNYDCPILKAKSNCSIKLKFDSQIASSGLISESLIISNQSVSLSITVILPQVESPNLDIVPEINFGMLPKKNIVLKTIILKNLGTQTFRGPQASINFLNGAIVYDLCSGQDIKPKSTCVMKVSVDGRTASSDPIFGNLNFAGYSISLIANVVEPLNFDESPVDLDAEQSINVNLGIVNPPYTLLKTLIFVNEGTSTTTPFTANFIPGTGIFLLSNNCQGVALIPQGSCSIKLAMPSSSGLGTKTATLQMGDYTINLTGAVVAAVVNLPQTPITTATVPSLPPGTTITNLPPGCSLGGNIITCGQPTIIPPPKLACASQHIYQNGQCVLVNIGGGNNCPDGQYYDGNACVAVVYEARSFSAYGPPAQVCGGIVQQTRHITSCFRVDTNQSVLNSFCIDPNPSIDVPSPAGALPDLSIVGGTQHRACNAGDSNVQITGVDCLFGYLRQGDLCIPYNLQVPSTKGFNGQVSSIVVLSTGDIVYGGSFDSFTDNDTTLYNLRGVVKFSSSGQIDTTFINNIGTNISGGGGNALVVDSNDNIYGATTGGVLWKSNSSGVINNTFKNNTNNKVSGVKALALDSSGNLIIGGFFTAFGSQANNARGIAKLSSDGVFDQTFSDNLDLVPGVKSAATSGITGTLAADLTVNTLAIDSSGNIYAGGTFYSFNGVNNNANKILKLSSAGVFDQNFSNTLDAIPGTKTNSSGFSSSTNVPVNKIIVDGSNLYIGGAFSHFKGSNFSAMKIAKLSTSGVFDQTFSNNLDVVSGNKGTTSGFNNPVNDIALDNGSLYVVGGFTQFKTTVNNANRIAKLSTSGVFDQTFSNSIDRVSGVKANSSGFNLSALTILIKDSQIFVGGGFDSFKNNSAKFAAKFSTAGTFTSFIASSSLFNGIVYDIKQDLDGNTYFAGNFTYYNGKYSPYLLKLNSDFEIDETFMTNIGDGFNSFVATLALDTSGNVFAGGNFTSFNGVANVNRIIKLSSTGVMNSVFMNNLDLTPGTKAATSGFNSNVTIIKLGTDGNLYVGGGFQRVKNNTSAKWLAKLSNTGVLSTSFITGYGTGLNNAIYGLGLDQDHNIYVTGIFTSFGGIANNANGLAKFSTDGVFNQTFSDSLDITPGTKTASSGFLVNPGITQGQGILVEQDMLFLAGTFGQFKGTSLTSRALFKFDLDGTLDQAFQNNMKFSSGALCVDTDGENLYVVGGFSGWDGVSYTARGIVKMSFTGILNQDFMDHLNADYQDSANPGTANNNSGFDSIVQTVSVGIHGELLIGGQFSSFKKLKYERAVILNADGSLPVR